MTTHTCVSVTSHTHSVVLISSQSGGERQSRASPVRCQSSQSSGQSLTLPLLQSTSLHGGGSSDSLVPSVRSSLSSVCTASRTSDLCSCRHHTSKHERSSSERRRRTRLLAVILISRRHRTQQTRGEEGETGGDLSSHHVHIS